MSFSLLTKASSRFLYSTVLEDLFITLVTNFSSNTTLKSPPELIAIRAKGLFNISFQVHPISLITELPDSVGVDTYIFDDFISMLSIICFAAFPYIVFCDFNLFKYFFLSSEVRSLKFLIKVVLSFSELRANLSVACI